MTDHAPTVPSEESVPVGVLHDRLRSMHVTLLFIAVMLCVVVGMNLLLIATD